MPQGLIKSSLEHINPDEWVRKWMGLTYILPANADEASKNPRGPHIPLG